VGGGGWSGWVSLSAACGVVSGFDVQRKRGWRSVGGWVHGVSGWLCGGLTS
jgi:hypothetical protein